MVASEVESTDPVDPLVGYSSFSLFPRSFNSSSFSELSNSNSQSDSLHSHLKTMMLKSPDKLVNQAKIILDESSDLLKTDKAAVISKDKTEVVSTANDKNAQDRRPALGLKRAKFSAKPMPSQPDMSLEPTIDIDKLKDPEEFFAAYERIENAKRELQRLKGQPLLDLDQNRPSLPPRHRRPSLFGKSASYNHRSYSSNAMPDYGETPFSSQEAFDHDVQSPSRGDAIPETNVMDVSPHARVSDSSSKLTSKLSELDELLSCNYDGLDEDGIQSLLQDKLHLKVIDIGKASLPDMPDVRHHEIETSSEALPKVKGMIFHLNNLGKSVSSKLTNFSNQLRESSVHHQVSPTQSKSPLASLSLLNRHISKLTPLKDPFSPLDIDSSPAEPKNRKQADPVDKRKELHKSLRSSVHEQGTAEIASPPPALAGNGIGHNSASREQLDENSQSDLIVKRKDSNEIARPAAYTEKNAAVAIEKLSSPTAKRIVPTSEHEDLVDEDSRSDQVGTRKNLCLLTGSPVHKEVDTAVCGEDSLASAVKDVHFSSDPREQDDEEAAAWESVRQKVFSKGSAAENSGVKEVEEDQMGDPSNAQGICDKEPAKKTVESSKRKFKETGESTALSEAHVSEETVNKGRKTKSQLDAPVAKEARNKRRKVAPAPPGPSKVNEKLRRHSLYGAGTKWEAGLRRSTRIRMRPLEYWRGERFLYGRVHQSVVSVIGVKYASPEKEADKPAVKVKSFVSDQYKDLVDLASLH